MLVTGLPGAHNNLIDPPPALVSIIIYPNIIIILRRTLVKNKWKNLFSKRIDQRKAPEWIILNDVSSGRRTMVLCRLFHVYGKHYPCFFLLWLASEGREGRVGPPWYKAGPYYSLLHPIDRLHNTAINNPVIPPVPIYVLNYSGTVSSQSMAKLTY